MCLSPPEADTMCAMSRPPVPECENKARIDMDMENLRSAPFSTRRTTAEYIMLCLVGFGSIDRRDALMRMLQWALEPLMLYSAFIKETPSNEFETILVTKKQIVIEELEQWLELFNMGICLIQFDGYMQPDMVTCISRIHHSGKHWFGTFKSKSAARVRRDFYAQYGKDQRAKDIARVLAVTGLAMTPQNMLHLHDRVVTLQNRVSGLERDLDHARRDNLSRVNDAAFAANLANAYRRMGRVSPPVIAIPPVMLPAMQMQDDVPPPPPPESPIYIRSPEPALAQVHSGSFVRRPPPTGEVTLIVVRE